MHQTILLIKCFSRVCCWYWKTAGLVLNSIKAIIRERDLLLNYGAHFRVKSRRPLWNEPICKWTDLLLANGSRGHTEAEFLSHYVTIGAPFEKGIISLYPDSLFHSIHVVDQTFFPRPYGTTSIVPSWDFTTSGMISPFLSSRILTFSDPADRGVL